MKTIENFGNTFKAMIAAIVFISSVMLTACEKDKNDTNNNTQTYTTTGNASGAQENPAVTTTATGTLSGTYNASTNIWNYTINWSGLSNTATAVQLSGPATAGVNGNLVTALTITTPGATGTASGNVTLTEQQESDLLAGKYYYNILTATNVTGEVRGQIMATLQ